MSTILTKSPIPLYYQVTNLIKNQIISGEWSPGAKLPTEDEMAEMYGVSRLTVRKAKDTLIEEGLINSIQGSGSYVNDPGRWKVNPQPIETLDDLLERGQNSTIRVKEIRMIPNTEAVSKMLKNDADRFIFQIEGIRYSNDAPYSFDTYHFPFEVGSKINIDRLDDNPFVPHLEKHVGIKIAEGVYSFYPGRANQKAVEYLEVKPGTLVQNVTKIFYDLERKPLAFVKSVLQPGRSYRVRIRRSGM